MNNPAHNASDQPILPRDTVFTQARIDDLESKLQRLAIAWERLHRALERREEVKARLREAQRIDSGKS